MTHLPPIRYTCGDVALMVRIAAHDSIEHLAEATRTAPADLQLIAAGERMPSAGVLAAFDLTPAEGGYVWRPC